MSGQVKWQALAAGEQLAALGHGKSVSMELGCGCVDVKAIGYFCCQVSVQLRMELNHCIEQPAGDTRARHPSLLIPTLFIVFTSLQHPHQALSSHLNNLRKPVHQQSLPQASATSFGGFFKNRS